MPVFAVLYDYHPDSGGTRDRYRAEHREFLSSLAGKVTVLARGPFTDDPPGALLILQGPDAPAVEHALATDPFRREGVIARHLVRPWAQVDSPWAALD